MATDIFDVLGGESSCCGASIYVDMGICRECGEHCDDVSGLESPDDALPIAIPTDDLDDEELTWDDDEWFYGDEDEEDEFTLADEEFDSEQ